MLKKTSSEVFCYDGAMIETSTIAATVILAALFIFQVLLIAGVPLGKYAWGGQNKVLSRNLRIASLSSLFLYIVFAVFILSKGSVIDIIKNDAIVNIGMWVFTAYFFLGVVMNAISRSKPERMLMTPVALLLAVLFLCVALA